MGGSQIGLEVFTVVRARYGHHRLGAVQEPSQSYLSLGYTLVGGNPGEYASRSCERSPSQRKPRQEGNALTFAFRQKLIMATIDHVVAVLHRDDPGDSLCSVKFVDTDVRQTDVANEASLSQIG